ncbi:unnamed protein product [Brassica oleracea var. botrytis]
MDEYSSMKAAAEVIIILILLIALPVPKRNLGPPPPPSLPFGYTIPAECVEAAHKIHMAQKMTAE